MAKKRNRKARVPVEQLPVNFCKIDPLSPGAQDRFIARSAELNKVIGNTIRAWHGFKDADAEHKPYWLDIYKGCIGGLERMHAEINYEGA
jgi:hypothetical protein